MASDACDLRRAGWGNAARVRAGNAAVRVPAATAGSASIPMALGTYSRCRRCKFHTFSGNFMRSILLWLIGIPIPIIIILWLITGHA